MTTHNHISAAIVDRGNGYPDEGDYVIDGDGDVYRVIVAGSRIETRGMGHGNICLGYTLAPVDWADLDDEDVFPALAVID